MPKSERRRLNDQLNPSLQVYFAWLSTDWAEYFAEEREPPTLSSSSQWSSTSWWSPHSWSSNWQGWYQHSWQDDKWSEQRWSRALTCVENEVDSSLRKLGPRLEKDLSEVAMDKNQQTWPPSWFFCCVSRPVTRNSLNATGGVHRTTSPDSRTRTFFLVRTPRRIIRTSPVWEDSHWLKVK